MEDRLQDEFPSKYQESIGLPRYQQELDRLKRADIVHKNFSSRLEQSVKEQDTARKKLFIARREYTDRFKPCSFRVEAMDNDEFESERRLLEESELPKYREKINAARESAMEQFQNDFLAKLKEDPTLKIPFQDADNLQDVLAVISQWSESDNNSIAFARFVCSYLYPDANANPKPVYTDHILNQ